ncbi:MAG: ABC transporter permease, partial [Bryobacterales bacterium]|nr:ABC transporter permease [Bryobacterales bacterium]
MVGYHDVRAEMEDEGVLRLRFHVENRTRETWPAHGSIALGSQIFDPETGLFITEGKWAEFESDVAPGARVAVELAVALPPQPGDYRVYVSPVDSRNGWFYQRSAPFLALDASLADTTAAVRRVSTTTLRRLRWANAGPAILRLFTDPFRELWQSRSLIASMVQRDILARYRGSFGDALWTLLYPLLLMTTYFFVFGVVLQTRFGADQSRTGFALYFLAGMLPWLQFSEPATRATFVILEHRVFVKKLVFPVSILPVNQAIAGLVTSLLATAIFLIALVLARGAVPVTALALPLLLIPQILFTLGICWFLAATGVYLRDLAQVIGLLLTLWFFLTPICYPETSLPAALAPLLMKNPMFQFVRGYREIFLEAQLPQPQALVKLWLVAGA